MCLKDNCQGFQKTPLEIMPGVSLPIFFMPKLKSFGVAPTSPTGQGHLRSPEKGKKNRGLELRYMF